MFQIAAILSDLNKLWALFSGPNALLVFAGFLLAEIFVFILQTQRQLSLQMRETIMDDIFPSLFKLCEGHGIEEVDKSKLRGSICTLMSLYAMQGVIVFISLCLLFVIVLCFLAAMGVDLGVMFFWMGKIIWQFWTILRQHCQMHSPAQDCVDNLINALNITVNKTLEKM